MTKSVQEFMRVIVETDGKKPRLSLAASVQPSAHTKR